MGSGKSTVGERLAEHLEVPFVDLDAAIEKKENLSISSIFDEKGAIYFRKREHELLLDLLADSDNLVLSLGGGTPCYYDNMQLLSAHDAVTSIYLNVDIPTLANRLWEGKSQRPLIAAIQTKEELTEFIGKHLFERRQFYQQADLQLNYGAQSIEETLKSIVTLLP